MELSREDTKMLQGLSVLAMVCLHLFCTYSYSDKFAPMLMVGDLPLVFYVAQLCDFCVFGFAFCSGYGHYVQFAHEDYYRNRIKGVLSLMCSYWIILVSFSVVSWLVGQGSFMPGGAGKFVLNALTLESSYNGAWWYMFTYLILVLISPLLLTLFSKGHPIVILTAGFAFYCIGYYVRFGVQNTNWFLIKFGPFAMTLFEYEIGAICCRFKIVSFVHKIWGRLSYLGHLIVSSLVLLILLYVRTNVIQNMFVAPISGMLLMLLFVLWEKMPIIKELFLFFGEHATNIWLIHMFFYIKPFTNFVYIAKYPIFIYFMMLGITVSISSILKLIEKPLNNRIASM